MDIIQTIYKRRSIRNYLDKKVEKEARTRLDEKRVYWQEYEPSRKHRAKNNPTIGHY